MGNSQILVFAVIAGLVTITPGADTMLVIRNVMARGRMAGLQTTVGACCGLFVHATLSAFGLSLLLIRSAAAFEMLKLVGAGYLVWLGIRAVREAMRREVGPTCSDGRVTVSMAESGLRSLLEGFLSNVLNPKVAVFYLAFLPQFITSEDWVFGKSMLLAAIHFVEGVIWLSAVTFFVSGLQAWISRPHVRRVIEVTGGVVLIGFGARLALERTR